ncbi:MAG: hypothetical protein PHD40_06865 [Syntrophomonadaceae bacterium]|nr:hypothetical protein [Syntrophomonadaceae bacterium]
MIQAGLDYSRDWQTPIHNEPVPNIKRIKRTYKRTNVRSKLFVKMGLFAFVYAVVLVYLCIKGASLGYQIVSLEKEIADLETDNKRMEYRIAQVNSLDRIEALATTQLGMIKPQQAVAVAAIKTVPEIEEGNQTIPTLQAERKPLDRIYSNLVRLAQKNL